MTRRTGVDLHFFHRGPGMDHIAANAGDDGIIVLGMNLFFHDIGSFVQSKNNTANHIVSEKTSCFLRNVLAADFPICELPRANEWGI